jgi:hypothetical protein
MGYLSVDAGTKMRCATAASQAMAWQPCAKSLSFKTWAYICAALKVLARQLLKQYWTSASLF